MTEWNGWFTFAALLLLVLVVRLIVRGAVNRATWRLEDRVEVAEANQSHEAERADRLKKKLRRETARANVSDGEIEAMREHIQSVEGARDAAIADLRSARAQNGTLELRLKSSEVRAAKATEVAEAHRSDRVKIEVKSDADRRRLRRVRECWGESHPTMLKLLEDLRRAIGAPLLLDDPEGEETVHGLAHRGRLVYAGPRRPPRVTLAELAATTRELEGMSEPKQPTVTKDHIIRLLREAKVRTTTLGEKTTLVHVTLANGFEITQTSACVDPANYDEQTGRRLALGKIEQRLWELEGYRLQCAIGEPGLTASEVEAALEKHNARAGLHPTLAEDHKGETSAE